MTVAGPTGSVDVDPLLVAAVGEHRRTPGGAGVVRDEDVGRVHTVIGQTVEVQGAVGCELEHRIGAEDPGVENGAVGPVATAVGGMGVTRLTEVTGDGVELAPADGDPKPVAGVDRDGRLVGGIADDIGPGAVGVDLDVDVFAQRPNSHRRDHALVLGNRHERVIDPLVSTRRIIGPTRPGNQDRDHTEKKISPHSQQSIA